MADELELRLLREYIHDPSGSSQKWDDDKLRDHLTQASGDLQSAAAAIWRIKAATVATWYQASLDGAFMSREQVFDHCIKMAELYESLGSNQMVNVQLATATSASIEPSSEF